MTLDWPLNVPVLTDGTVTLRAHTPADIDDMHQMANDPVFAQFTAVAQPHTREMSEEFALSVIPAAWNEGTAHMWAIEARDDDGRPRYAGNVDIRGTGNPDIGYGLHPWARGRGLMARAVRLTASWTFDNTTADVIRWAAHVGNTASLRVAHSVGFELDAVVPALIHEKGRTIDAWVGTLRTGTDFQPRTRWAEPIELTGDRVVLRALTQADVGRIAEASADEQTQHWLSHIPRHYAEADAHDYLAKSVWLAARAERATWAIADPQTRTLCGTILIGRIGQATPIHGEIGYWLHPDSRGRSLLAEAAQLAIDHACDPNGLGLQVITLRSASANAASVAVAHRLGMRHVGTHRNGVVLGDGSFDDLEEFELVA